MLTMYLAMSSQYIHLHIVLLTVLVVFVTNSIVNNTSIQYYVSTLVCVRSSNKRVN